MVTQLDVLEVYAQEEVWESPPIRAITVSVHGGGFSEGMRRGEREGEIIIAVGYGL